MENSLSILTRLLRKENFEFWIVENSEMLNYVTKIFIWREKKILNVLTVTSASKEIFLTFEDLIVQIESLVSDLNTKLEIRNLYEFLGFNEADYSEYWDYDEDGEVFVSKREQIESDLIEFIKKNLTDKYSFDYPNLVDETKDYSW